MLKAIFFDLDGTLLNSDKIIPPSAIRALEKCREKGVRLFLSTARPPSLVNALSWSDYEQSLFDGGVYCNGAIKTVNGKTEFSYIDKQIVESIVKEMENYNDIGLALQMKNNLHAFKYPLSESDYKIWGIENEEVLSTSNCKYDETIKILIYDGDFANYLNPMPEQLINNISKICGKLAKMYVTDNGCVIQVSDKSVSKYIGIETIRNYLNLKKEEIAVFGDDLNDLEMISGYPISVAMGNGAEEIKKAAAYITLRNDNDGIAYAIDNFLFLWL